MIKLVCLLGLLSFCLADSCKWKSTMNANFDVSALTLAKGPFYEITDGDIPCTSTTEKNYTYVFNVCGKVATPPESCTALGAQYAFQYDPLSPKDPDSCFLLGSAMSFQQIDPSNPAAGVSVVYTGGQKCNSGAQNPRQLTIQIPCIRTDPSVISPVSASEPSHCQYQAIMPSVHGCPVECKTLHGKVCNDHGICQYDTARKAPRCFCDSGFAGDGCSSKSSGGSSSLGVVVFLLILILLVIIVLGAIIVIMVQMLRQYRKDASNFMAMHGGNVAEEDEV